MAEISYFRRMVDGVPVVAAPAEIDITAAEQLDAVLLATVSRGHMTVVVDMTRTRFCDCRALHTLLRAHKRIRADGGELRLVLPAGSTVSRIFSLTGLNRFISHFGSLPDALLQQPADTIRPSDPSSSAGPGFPHYSKARTGRREENRAGRSLLPQFLLGVCTIKD
jgi:anti-sigma B factor antagonist